ncbi:hemolysin family protein [Daejeonella oryzae]|uniref:hemolysin family protein n=1 Tax=Daejeonella oryzae TaxID=1122943 RepID=UPI000417D03D|nr:hemolysin family protein [Daejeonella oryzae]
MEILIIAFLILLNGVFSMSEIALVSSRRFTLESIAKKGNKNAQKALDLAASPNTFLSTVQIGITLIGILTGVFSGETLTKPVVESINTISFLAPYSDTLAVVFVVFIITYFSIVFGELIPKRIGLSFPETIATMVARPMNVLSSATKPFIWLLVKTNDLVLGLFGIKEKQEGIITEEEIKSIIAESTSSGEIQEIEEDIVKRVFALGDRKAGELMTHRSDIMYIDITDDIDEIRRKIKEDRHPVYPVINKSPEKLLGTISVNQIFTESYQNELFDLNGLLQKPFYVQENMAAYKVLERFKEDQVHMVFVVDEFGSVQGILSVTDVVDALIGEVSLSVNEELSIVKRNENSWLADGQYPYHEFVEYFGLNEAEEADGFTTLGGLILKNVHHYPKTGEKIRWRNFELEIMDMDEMRIDKVLITKIR